MNLKFYYKIFGFVLLLFCGWYISISIIANMKNRIKQLESVGMMLFDIEYIICDEGKLLPEAFIIVSGHRKTKIEKMFYETGRMIEENHKQFSQVWCEKIDEYTETLGLSENESNILKKLCNNLGNIEIDKQRKSIANVRDLIKQQIEYRVNEKKNKEKPIIY